jgi:hypothetical protein
LELGERRAAAIPERLTTEAMTEVRSVTNDCT